MEASLWRLNTAGSLSRDKIKERTHLDTHVHSTYIHVSICKYLKIHASTAEKGKWGLAGFEIISEITQRFYLKPETQTVVWFLQNHKQALPTTSSNLKWLDCKIWTMALQRKPKKKKKRMKMNFITDIHPVFFENTWEDFFFLQFYF